jgi:EAL domain-containing protein (putative c-di-GMP-specific phosphodiesterase class I)
LGGDEFLILSPPTTEPDAAEQIAMQVLNCLAEPILIDGQELIVTLSIGISIWPNDADDFDGLLKCAEVAMYRAKAEGRHTFRFFTEQMNAQALAHLQLRNALGQALARRELELHYQPQIDMVTGALTGVEALLRWRNQEGQLIPPASFIPLAEESGLIIPIGEWVLEEACRQAVRWQQEGLPPFPVAVNLSAVQFKHNSIKHNASIESGTETDNSEAGTKNHSSIEFSVRQALSASGLSPHLLELELTESLLLDDVESVLATVKRLKSLGIRLSIDDFGTGYSSLAYLKRFAVDTLKIDQSFVRDILTDPDDRAIVQAIIGMAHNLKLKVLAEGVETAEMAQLLSEYGCEQAQGYYFARPMPAKSLSDWVRNYPQSVPSRSGIT